MRELVFELEHGPKINPIMEIFNEYPELSSSLIDGIVNDNTVWRIERVIGPTEGLDTVTECLKNYPENTESDNLIPSRITGINILESTETRRDLYIRFESIQEGRSVHKLAAKYLGSNIIFEIERRENSQYWRIMYQSEENVGLLYDALHGLLQPEISLHFDHVGAAKGWQTTPFSGIDMSAKQRTALISAVEHGYYESPREISLQDLSDNLGWPRSTLSYRLRQAEAELAEAFAGITKPCPEDVLSFLEQVDE